MVARKRTTRRSQKNRLDKEIAELHETAHELRIILYLAIILLLILFGLVFSLSLKLLL